VPAVCCFILALGNRPQGSKGFYLVIAISFALIMVYMLVRSLFSLLRRPAEPV